MKTSFPIIACCLLLLLEGMMLSGCQPSGNKNNPGAASGNNAAGTQQPQQPAMTEAQRQGQALYKKYCLTCHQSNGTGVPNLFPPLTPGSWTGKDPAELIALILKGLNGEIEVDGQQYKNVMPPQLNITDAELAGVLTYVRSSFGNHFSPVTTDMVHKVRTKP